MRNLQARKWISPSLLALLGLTLWLLFLPSGLVRADPPDPPPPTPVWEKLDPPYPPSEVSPPLAPLSVQGTLKAFQAVADAEVRQGNPAENFGIEPIMGAGYDNYTPENRLIQRALLRFDVSHFLPPGSTIHQATLSLYMVGYCDVGSSTFQTYRVTDDWFELTTTWNNQPSFAEGYGSTVIPVGGTTFGWYTFDVTALVQAWVNGDYPEYGLMIRGPEAPPYQCAFREFLTKGGGGFNSAPELVVDYTAPPPALAVSQNDLTFLHQCGIGAPAPLPQVIAVQSNDEILNDWTANVTGGDGWLSLSKTANKVSRIFPDQIEISVNETTPCPGTVTAQIQISAPNLGSSPQTINVTLQQSAAPVYWLYLPLVIKNDNAGLNYAGSSASSTNRIALIISIADYYYLDDPPTFSVLRSGVWGANILGPRSDGGAMQQVLLADAGTVLVLAEDHATRENIEFAFSYIAERVDANTEVVIYYSGHGGPTVDTAPLDEVDGFDELLAAFDTNDTPQFVDHILDDNLEPLLANLGTEHLAVIIDACNSGGMEVSNPYRAVLAASREDQNSWETSEFEHGVFTYYMLQAMLDASSDTNGDGWLSVQEIYNYARGPVADYVSSNTNEEQDLALNLTRDVNVVRISSTISTAVAGQ